MSVFLSLYGSGFLNPTSAKKEFDVGNGFQLNAEARLKKYDSLMKPGDQKKTYFIPTEEDLAEAINKYTEIKRIDIYTHAYGGGLNLGGYIGKRTYKREKSRNSKWDVWDWFDSDDDVRSAPVFEDVEIDGTTMDWSNGWKNFVTDDVRMIEKSAVKKDCEIFLWGCNSGGRDQSEKEHSIANKLAEHLGCTVYGYVGGGGTMFVTNSAGKLVYNGNMITAQISLNNEGKDLSNLDPMKYLTKFPI